VGYWLSLLRSSLAENALNQLSPEMAMHFGRQFDFGSILRYLFLRMMAVRQNMNVANTVLGVRTAFAFTSRILTFHFLARSSAIV
jgi:hypothetical protein